MKKIKNYRKQYEKLCNIKIPKSYEIHHINLNHEDNKIENNYVERKQTIVLQKHLIQKQK